MSTTASGIPERLRAVIAGIGPLDASAMAAAAEHLDGLTKPPGSLGRLEGLAVHLAGITGRPRAPVEPRMIVVFAADHGVTVRGVSPYPSAVTAQMVANFLGGGAAINALADLVAADVIVVDVGVADPVPTPPRERHGHARLVSRPIRRGSRDLSVGPALTVEETLAAIDIGIDLAEELHRDGVALAGVGEMGIGNTTAASAVVAALTQRRAREVTGRGTGADDAMLAHKVAVIDAALADRPPDRSDPVAVLASVGGLEIAAMTGFILGVASRRIPIVLDGFITGAAALAATRLCPTLPERLIAGHRSPEPGHTVVLDELGLEPLLDLGLRLGEGTGAALAMGIVEASARARDRMATFGSAGISHRVRAI